MSGLPIPQCYWVVPGKLMAGEYPRDKDEQSSRAKIAKILGAGITSFIDLTEEHEGLEPYAGLIGTAAHERFPIVDMSIPNSPAEMVAALDDIDRSIANGRAVYVHCWGGVGRTGTIVGCWLVRHGLSGADALDRVAELFSTTPKFPSRRSPERPEQEEYILNWREGQAISSEQRYIGCLMGLAVGDALGTTVEFKSPGSFRPIADMVGGGPFGLRPGEWTDDTSMALCLAESLLECGEFDAHDQIDRYVRWFEQGHLSSTGRCFDIGGATRAALDRYARKADPLAGSTRPDSAGNGSLMRLAPVPMFFASEPELAIAMCADSSRTTHAAATCIDACRYFGGLVVGALRGVPKAQLLADRFSPAEGLWDRSPLCEEIDDIALGSFKRKNPPQIVGSGYVVKSLEAALWAFQTTDTFDEGCLAAVNLGDDADTTGAIYGQLAGAYYGVDAIRAAWRERVAMGGLIISMARELGGGHHTIRS